MTGLSKAARRSQPRLSRLPQAERDRIGIEFHRARSTKGLSQRTLADHIGVTPAAISAVENGRIGMSLDRLTKAADLLGVDLPQLIQAGSSGPPGDHGLYPRTAGTDDVDWRAFPTPRLDAPLQGALSAFLDLGYHGATVRDIAARAGLSVPGLYHYYPNKHALLVELLRMTMDDIITRCRAARAEGTRTAERFAFLVECLALFHIHRRQFGLIAFSEMRSLGPEAHKRHLEDRRLVQDMVLDEVDRGRLEKVFLTPKPHEAARAVVATCMAIPQWFSEDGSSTAEEVAKQHVEIAFDIVRCPIRRRPNLEKRHSR
ncbi:MAG: TetR family transcriptional regulator [Actinophytocola sp.]|uniref:TetR family transcriptional regulator n=1 Tax=Actinophytocola sp. TaxID=1872138 RepID=UPI00132B12C6|nr:TetR family transcriptional regulator [Actinophytocola sp.]MPZ83201.1 TetR family transcriptional regulator [Actinophytocola sp.]